MAVSITMPRLGDFMMEGTVTKWSKSSGDYVRQGEVIAEIETEKINYELEAIDSGILHLIAEEGDMVEVDGLLGYLLTEGESPPIAPVPQPQVGAQTPALGAPFRTPTSHLEGIVPSTPGARRLAAKLGLDISRVTLTGSMDRVIEDDVRAFAERHHPVQASPLPTGLPSPTRIVPLQGIRKTIAEHMRDSISTTAQLTFMLEIDVTKAMSLRREASKRNDMVITAAHVLIKACAETLKIHPAHNTLLSNGNILYFGEVNIGIAVALDDGLIVPVIRSADKKDILQISRETHEAVDKARRAKLLHNDVVGGTFTISVLGTVDGFTPILNRGQSAILGVGRSIEKPVVRKGEITIREMMSFSLTVDHQVIDGAVAASFLRRLQQTIERPAPLFI